MAPNPILSRFVLALALAYGMFAFGAWWALRAEPAVRPRPVRPASVTPRLLPSLPKVLPPCGSVL